MDKKPDAKYCQRCGGRMPFDSNYCPLCGLEQRVIPQTTQGNRRRGYVTRNIRRIRLTLIIASLLVFIIGLAFGSYTQLSYSDAQSIIEEFRRIIINPTALNIASNNVLICMIFFVPAFGTFFMALVSYNTGMVLSATAHLVPSITPLDLLLTTFLFPWTWLELAAYSLASAQGILLILGILTGRFRKEVKTTLLTVLICLILLVIGAIIEASVLSSL